jgi:hypothetical protein
MHLADSLARYSFGSASVLLSRSCAGETREGKQAVILSTTCLAPTNWNSKLGNFRFYRRVNLFPGLSLNLSRSGPSVTVGMRGAHLTLGRRGITRTIGILGTGVYYTSRAGYHSGFHSAHVETPIDQKAQARANTVASLALFAVALLMVLGIGVIIGSALSH